MKFVVGGVGVELTGCPGPYDPAWGDELAFVDEAGSTDIELCVSEVAEITLPAGASMAFDGRPLWSMYRVGEGYMLALWLDDVVVRAVEIDPHTWTGHILLRRDLPGSSLATRALHHPLILLLVSWRIAYLGGALLHACGVQWRDHGIAFLGRSDAGKTTTSRLWARDRDALVLNDDRVIARLTAGQYSLSGTPWYGDGRVCANSQVDLDALLCIRHGAKNALTALGPGEALAELFASTVLPFYDPTAMDLVQETHVRLVETIPTMTYDFVPDDSAVRCVQEFLRSAGAVPRQL